MQVKTWAAKLQGQPVNNPSLEHVRIHVFWFVREFENHKVSKSSSCYGMQKYRNHGRGVVTLHLGSNHLFTPTSGLNPCILA